MDAASMLEKLPSEVMIMIMRSISSPIDLQSVINASPVIFQLYLAHRSFIMAPIIHRMKKSYAALEPGRHWTLIINTLPYRMLGNNNGPVGRQGSCYTNWESHLPLICELHRQREEAHHLITEYSTEAWKRLLSRTEQSRLRLRLASERYPIVDRPLILSEQEICAFERGFLLYESWRLYMQSDGSNHLSDLSGLKCNDSHNVTVPHWKCVDAWPYGRLSSDRFNLDPILWFVFDKFKTLLHLVAQQLRKHPSKSPAISGSGDNQTSKFLSRTENQELRYIRFLCLRGYALLQNLRQMKEEELQNYVLSSYSEFAIGDAKLGSSAVSLEKRCVNRQLACRLRNRYEGGGMTHDFMEAYILWDGSRIRKVEPKWWMV